MRVIILYARVTVLSSSQAVTHVMTHGSMNKSRNGSDWFSRASESLDWFKPVTCEFEIEFQNSSTDSSKQPAHTSWRAISQDRKTCWLFTVNYALSRISHPICSSNNSMRGAGNTVTVFYKECSRSVTQTSSKSFDLVNILKKQNDFEQEPDLDSKTRARLSRCAFQQRLPRLWKVLDVSADVAFPCLSVS